MNLTLVAFYGSKPEPLLQLVNALRCYLFGYPASDGSSIRFSLAEAFDRVEELKLLYQESVALKDG